MQDECDISILWQGEGLCSETTLLLYPAVAAILLSINAIGSFVAAEGRSKPEPLLKVEAGLSRRSVVSIYYCECRPSATPLTEALEGGGRRSQRNENLKETNKPEQRKTL